MINKNNLIIIKSLAYFSARQIDNKPYLSKGVKRTFHSKVALTIENSCFAQPKIYIKKINIDKAKTIALKTPNNLGHIRHFPAATKE